MSVLEQEVDNTKTIDMVGTENPIIDTANNTTNTTQRDTASVSINESSAATMQSADTSSSTVNKNPVTSSSPSANNASSGYTSDNNSVSSNEGTDDVTKMDPNTLMSRLKAQIEYYFSQANLNKDAYMMSQMNAEGYIPITVIAEFKKVKKLAGDATKIADAIADSNICSLNEDKTAIKASWKKPARTTIILRDVQEGTTEDEIKALLDGTEYKISSVRADVGNTWFMSMDTEDDAKNAILHLYGCNLKGQPVKARLKSENVSNTLRGTAPAWKPQPYSQVSAINPAIVSANAGAVYNSMQNPGAYTYQDQFGNLIQSPTGYPPMPMNFSNQSAASARNPNSYRNQQAYQQGYEMEGGYMKSPRTSSNSSNPSLARTRNSSYTQQPGRKIANTNKKSNQTNVNSSKGLNVDVASSTAGNASSSSKLMSPSNPNAVTGGVNTSRRSVNPNSNSSNPNRNNNNNALPQNRKNKKMSNNNSTNKKAATVKTPVFKPQDFPSLPMGKISLSTTGSTEDGTAAATNNTTTSIAQTVAASTDETNNATADDTGNASEAAAPAVQVSDAVSPLSDPATTLSKSSDDVKAVTSGNSKGSWAAAVSKTVPQQPAIITTRLTPTKPAKAATASTAKSSVKTPSPVQPTKSASNSAEPASRPKRGWEQPGLPPLKPAGKKEVEEVRGVVHDVISNAVDSSSASVRSNESSTQRSPATSKEESSDQHALQAAFNVWGNTSKKSFADIIKEKPAEVPRVPVSNPSSTYSGSSPSSRPVASSAGTSNLFNKKSSDRVQNLNGDWRRDARSRREEENRNRKNNVKSISANSVVASAGVKKAVNGRPAAVVRKI